MHRFPSSSTWNRSANTKIAEAFLEHEGSLLKNVNLLMLRDIISACPFPDGSQVQVPKARSDPVSEQRAVRPSGQ
jgi:hypothetical protein